MPQLLDCQGLVCRAVRATSARACRRLLAAALAAVALGTALTEPALAQSEYLSERDIRDRGAPSEPGKDFKLTFAMPLLFTTSVLAADSDGRTIDQSDWHVFPDLQLKWTHQFERVRLIAYGATSADRYFDVADADSNILEGGIIAELTDGSSDRFVPYFSFITRSYFESDFEATGDTRFDIALGVFSGWGWRGDRDIRFRDAVEPGDNSLGVDFQVGRREATQTEHEHTFTSMSLDYSYTFRKDFWIVLGPKIRLRWYEDYFDEFRRDVRFSFLASAVWQPEWLTDIMPNTQIVLSAEYFKNWSTDEPNAYSLWEFGPTLKVSTRF